MFTAIQRIRVEWAHCDAAGIIFNPHYYIWMDNGTHALFRAAGFDLPRRIHEDRLFIGLWMLNGLNITVKSALPARLFLRSYMLPVVFLVQSSILQE